MNNANNFVKPYVSGSRCNWMPRPSSGIVLDRNEAPWDLPRGIKEEIAARLLEADWRNYPDDEKPELLSRLSAYAGQVPEGLILGNGSDEMIQTVIYACADRGDVLATVTPEFGMYKSTASLMGIRTVEVPLDGDMRFDVEGIIAAARGARVVLLSSPNNPAGTLLGRGDVEAILSSTEALVVIDEAYYEYSGATCLPLLERYANLAILRTFSKAFRLAGARLGYLIGRPELVAELKKARMPFSVGAFQQAAAEVILGHRDVIAGDAARVVAERGRVFAALQAMKDFRPYPSASNYILLQSKVLGGSELCARLAEAGVNVRDFGAPNLKDKVRVTIGTPEENDLLIKLFGGLDGKGLTDR